MYLYPSNIILLILPSLPEKVSFPREGYRSMSIILCEDCSVRGEDCDKIHLDFR